METHYEANLNHVAEPADPSDRDEAASVDLPAWKALFLREMLREFGHYGDGEDRCSIALAYAHAVETQVFEYKEQQVSLYAHTGEAIDTLFDAIYNHVPDMGKRSDYPMTVFVDIEDEVATTGAAIDYEDE